MNIRVNINGGNPRGNISMNMEEYVEFIKEQSDLLNIEKKTKHPVANIDFGKPNGDTTKNTLIIDLPVLNHIDNKLVLDKLAKDISRKIRENRGINQC